MQLKNFFSKKYIIFYLAVLAFILLLVATLAIGLKGKDTSTVVVLQDIAKMIKDANDAGVTPPALLNNTFGLLVSGLVFSGVSLIFLCINLFNFQKIGKYQKWIWLTGMFFVLLSMVLVLAGESYFANESLNGAKFGDRFDAGAFVGLIICITVVPLTTLILGGIWYSSMNKK